RLRPKPWPNPWPNPWQDAWQNASDRCGGSGARRQFWEQNPRRHDKLCRSARWDCRGRELGGSLLVANVFGSALAIERQNLQMPLHGNGLRQEANPAVACLVLDFSRY